MFARDIEIPEGVILPTLLDPSNRKVMFNREAIKRDNKEEKHHRKVFQIFNSILPIQFDISVSIFKYLG